MRRETFDFILWTLVTSIMLTAFISLTAVAYKEGEEEKELKDMNYNPNSRSLILIESSGKPITAFSGENIKNVSPSIYWDDFEKVYTLVLDQEQGNRLSVKNITEGTEDYFEGDLSNNK